MQIKLNNNILYYPIKYLNIYALTLNNKESLKCLNMLFSFKNIIITKKSFDIYLDALHKLNSIETLTLSIENKSYSDIALDIVYAVVSKPNIETITLDVLEYLPLSHEESLLKLGFLKYENEKDKIFKSNLKNLSISALRSNNSHVFFSMISNLPKLNSVSVFFI